MANYELNKIQAINNLKQVYEFYGLCDENDDDMCMLHDIMSRDILELVSYDLYDCVPNCKKLCFEGRDERMREILPVFCVKYLNEGAFSFFDFNKAIATTNINFIYLYKKISKEIKYDFSEIFAYGAIEYYQNKLITACRVYKNKTWERTNVVEPLKCLKMLNSEKISFNTLNVLLIREFKVNVEYIYNIMARMIEKDLKSMDDTESDTDLMTDSDESE